jgi:GTPase SAR1 family protein
MDSNNLRSILHKKLNNIGEFDAFCFDCFPEVYHQFSAGMQRTQKTTLLFEHVQDLELISQKLHTYGKAAAPLRLFDSVDLTARQHYLKTLRMHLQNQEQMSLRNTRFINITAIHHPAWPDASELTYAPAFAETFQTLDDALAKFGNRLLLLGAPGAGKTTLLRRLALKLLAKAERDEAEPLPLLLNLTKFQLYCRNETHSSPASSGWPGLHSQTTPAPFSQLEGWLIDEMAAACKVERQFDRALARAARWIASGRVAFLFDGLDEFSDTQRAELVRHLNQDVLNAYPTACIVISSREYEYRVLEENTDTTLQLPGAVMLQPLSEAQVDEYISALKSESLRQALVRDPALQELSRTPLLLSMMGLAYADRSLAEISQTNTGSSRIHALMQSFVAQMLRHEAKRGHKNNFGIRLMPGRAEPRNQYSQAQVEKWLGFLAVQMSVRMQTLCPRSKFFSFIQQGLNGRPATLERLSAFGLGIALAVSLLPTALLVLPWTAFGLVSGTGMLVLAALGPLLAVSVKRRLKSLRSAVELITLCFLPLAFTGLTAALIELCPDRFGPKDVIPLSLVSICIVAALSGVAVSSVKNLVRSERIGGILLAALSIIICLTWQPIAGVLLPVKYGQFMKLAVLLVAVQAVYTVFYFIVLGASWREVLRLLSWLVGVGVGVVAVQWGLNWIFGNPSGLKNFGLLSLGATLAFALTNFEAFEVWIAFAGAAFLGSLVAGGGGAVVGASLVALIGFLWQLSSNATAPPSWGDRALERARALLRNWLDRALLSPLLFLLLGIRRRLPFRQSAFFRFCGRALLLKSGNEEIEFVHRRVRDYFALSSIHQRLASCNGEGRLAAIRALGYQGESAIDPLFDFLQDRYPDVRIAAAQALGHIAAKPAVDCLERAISDKEPRVRAAVVRSLQYADAEHLARILSATATDAALPVRKAVFDVASTRLFGVIVSLPTMNRSGLTESGLSVVFRNLFPEAVPQPVLFRYALLHCAANPGPSVAAQAD